MTLRTTICFWLNSHRFYQSDSFFSLHWVYLLSLALMKNKAVQVCKHTIKPDYFFHCCCPAFSFCFGKTRAFFPYSLERLHKFTTFFSLTCFFFRVEFICVYHCTLLVDSVLLLFPWQVNCCIMQISGLDAMWFNWKILNNPMECFFSSFNYHVRNKAVL